MENALSKGGNMKEIKPKFYLSEIYSKDDLRKLFIERWNWNFPDIKKLHLDFPDELNKKIKSLEILAEKLQHKVIYFEVHELKNAERELKSIERKILSFAEVKKLVDFSIFIFSTTDYEFIDFVKSEKLGPKIQIKRFSITPETRNKLRTPSEQLENLNVLNKAASFSSIQECVDNAFSVEIVTKKFYEGYIDVFRKIKKALIRQKIEVEHKDKKLTEFTHQILNRIMFIYFIQKRGCFNGNKNFMDDFWDAYKSGFKGKNKFHTDWLTTLFFESLCNPPWLYKEKDYLGIFNEVLKNAPYLNGGLFERNELDNIGWVIPDKLFDDIFEFFESFNFTVEESTPLDIDIAINPEMLGNIYEHLVNIEERQEQKGSGIFYTPKTEIELMIRRSLVEFLYAKTRIKKDNIYYLIFEDETDIKKLFNRNEAAKILHELDQILILDPACGSGHYLVSVVKILYLLKERLWKYLGKKHLGKYEEKKKIIEKNIYGNDVKEWAVETAKLRLWLELFVDAEEERLKDYSAPLLPNFKFKIRSGDSLVQRIGTSLVPLRKIKSILTERREDLKYLIKKKESVYESGSVREYSDTIDWEKKILQNALGYMKIKLTQKLQRRHKRQTFNTDWSHKNEKEEKETEVLEKELKAIIEFKEALSKLKEPPMIWDLAFAEVFAKKNGFDIVIANPPYVRNEKIEDPTGFYIKTEYISKLIEQTIADWSYDYNGKLIYNPDSSTHPIPNNFPKKSDLYVYFYLKGLKLLNKNGVLCYISSNSWLDVKFGTKMQEILLNNVPIIAVYDSVKRSFKHADINTIIALMKAPITKGQKREVENNIVRFIMFKKSYEEIMDPDVFINIEKDDNLVPLTEGKMRSTDIYRLHTATQKELLEYGKGEKGNYEGNKWGGKYLRAPEIYWRILEKGKDKLVKLSKIAIIEGYIHGNNIGYKFPKTYFVESLEELQTIQLTIHSEGVVLYGVKNKGNSRKVADLLFPRMIGSRFFVVVVMDKIYGQKFYKIILNNKTLKMPISISLNSTFQLLQNEIIMNQPWGQGALSVNSYEVKNFYVLPTMNYDRQILENFYTREIKDIFAELGFDPNKPICEQEPNPLPDRKALDDVVFDALGLTDEERKEIYWAVAELVKQRLEKARSV